MPVESDGVEVTALGRGDAARAVPALVRAFWDFPETVHLLADARARRRVLPRFLGTDVRDSAGFDTLLAATDAGVVVGAAAWLPPSGYPVTAWRQVKQVGHLLPIAPWGVHAAREGMRGRRVVRDHHDRFGPHYYLRAIGVDPEHQGRGIGAALVRPMLARASAEGVGCYLTTTTEANVAWYLHLGFTRVATFHPTPGWPEVSAMWRDR
jgi:ribosomal protein S18 acetylase RimI-like enzyme